MGACPPQVLRSDHQPRNAPDRRGNACPYRRTLRHRECHPRSAAGQAQDHPPAPGQTEDRGAPAMVGQDAYGTAALEQHGGGDPLCDYPLGVVLLLPRRRHHRDRQQRRRAGDPADRARPQELVVRWIGQGRRSRRRHSVADRIREAQRSRSQGLSSRYPHAHRRPSACRLPSFLMSI